MRDEYNFWMVVKTTYFKAEYLKGAKKANCMRQSNPSAYDVKYGQWCVGSLPTGAAPNMECGVCPTGTVDVDGACQPCPSGTYSANGQCLDPPLHPARNNGEPDCPSKIKNPIHAGIGNKFQPEPDLPEDGLGGVAFARYYNSTGPVAVRGLGSGWSSTYSGIILPFPFVEREGVTVVRPNGRADIFYESYGLWTSGAPVAARLTELKDSSGVRTGWRYTTAADDTVETYDAAGKLLTIANRSGRVQTLTYDGAGRLQSVTDDLGRELVFGYDAYNHIETVTSAAGVITYGYDSDNNLVSVTYPDGKSKTYHYNESAHTGGVNLPHALTGITDENGDRYATYQYQADGRAITTGHAGGADLNTLAYNPDGTTTVTDPLGTQRTYGFTTILGVVKRSGLSQPGGSGCNASTSETSYDSYGNVASRTDFNGTKTCYVNDEARNLELARVEGLLAGTNCPVDLLSYTPQANTAERKITTVWHATFSLPTKITEPGRETTFAYDSYGNLTSRSVKDTVRSTTRAWTTTYTYHATVPGVVVRKVENGPRTDVSDLTTTDYYAPDENCAGGHYGCRGQVKQVTNALGHVTAYNEYDAKGHVTRITDPNGLVTTFTSTPRGWLETRNVGGEVTRLDYDGVGQVTKFTRPDGSATAFEYDAAHRLVAIVDQDGNRLVYTLDNAGNRIKEEITGPGGSPVYYTHSRSFDALGRLWQDIGAYNQTVTYEYDAQGNMKQIDGARTDVTDVTQHSYDALDRLIQTLNADGGIVQIKPNALDQITQVVDPASQTTTHTVNALGDTLQTVSADTGTTVRTYDTGGNLKTERDARAITVTYTYDALNRLTKKQSSQSGSPIYQYTYDTCANGVGRLCGSLRNSAANVSFSYDALGRLASRTDADGVNATTAYAYRPGGQIASLTYPSGRTVNYSYDAQGRISQVSTQPAGGVPVSVLAQNFVYGYPFAGPQSFQYGNGTGFAQTLDQDYRPVAAVDGPRNKSLGYDAAGNIASVTDASTDAVTYSYDTTGRLTSAIDSALGGFGTLGYSYDANGNRQSEIRNAGNVPYVYQPAGSNWLYQRGSDTRTKTASGNTAGITGLATFTYDGFNRIATAVTAAETTTYLYNAFGERMKKSNQFGLATVFHYGPNGELLWEKDANGNTKAYVWLDGRPLARIDNDASIYYYHVDHLGTPQAMTNSTGTVVWQADYEPFGKAEVKVSTVENNLRFPGQYYDRETNLHYNYFRDYDPSTGRYVQADPIGLAGGLNVYAYAEGNPLSYTDPLGLSSTAVWGTRLGTAGAMSAADGPAPIGDALAALYLVGSAVYDACKEPDDCARIEREVAEAARKIRERYFAMLNDPLDLFNKAYCTPNLGRRKGTYIGHGDQIKSWQNRLRNKIAEADAKGCKVDPLDRLLLGLNPPSCPAQ